MQQDQHPLAGRARGRVGTTLRDKWHLDSLLGIGGMAAVYSATHRNGKRVAVKILHSELSVDENLRARFLREGYAANKVAHSGAVSVLDDDTADDGSVYLVMDLLEGETLESKREGSGGVLRPAEVLDAIDQLLDVLIAAHDKGIIHRDIKPENLFLTRDGQLKVLDFGIARVRELSTASTATSAGSTMGTPAFMPPEQARGRWELVDARTDLWAVGATMFTLLTGTLVHQARTSNEQLLAAMTSRPIPISKVAPLLPEYVAAIVDKALAFDPKDRFADARAMQAELRSARQRLCDDPIVSSPTLPVSEPPPAGFSGSGGPLELRLSTGSAVVTGSTDGGSLSRTRRTAPLLIGAAIVLLAASVVVVALRPGRAPWLAPSAGLQSPIVATAHEEALPSAIASAQPSAMPAVSQTTPAPLQIPAPTVKPSKPRPGSAAPTPSAAPTQVVPDDVMDKRK